MEQLKNIKEKIFDFHVHIGQFEEIYYSPHKIIEVLHLCGVSGAYISSTTSCIQWSNDKEKFLITEHIKDEFNEAIENAKELNFDVRPLYWVIPQRHFDGDKLEEIFRETEYKGFKIHPRAHEWNLSDERIKNLMNEICGFASIKKFPILIHTGICEFERPEKFEEFYKKYPEVIFILAHCKAVKSVIKLFSKYKNIYGDTAFCDFSSLKEINEAGFSERMLFGTDFPITNFFLGIKTNNKAKLIKQYKKFLSEELGSFFTVL